MSAVHSTNTAVGQGPQFPTLSPTAPSRGSLSRQAGVAPFQHLLGTSFLRHWAAIKPAHLMVCRRQQHIQTTVRLRGKQEPSQRYKQRRQEWQEGAINSKGILSSKDSTDNSLHVLEHTVHSPERWRGVAVPLRVVPSATGLPSKRGPGLEIGRASCRERVYLEV